MKAGKLEKLLKPKAPKEEATGDEEEAITKGEETGKKAYQVTEAAINAMRNTIRRADSSTPPSKVHKEQGEKIEQRLESLARMYETKKTQKPKKEDDTGDTDEKEKK